MTSSAPFTSARLGKPLLLAPPIFIVHFLEESPGFVAWFNAHVARGITQDLFWTVNLVGLAVTVVVVGAEWFAPSTLTATAVVAWVSFLIIANALFHIVGALNDRGYMPGLITAIVLYLPFGGWVISQIVRSRRLPPIGVSIAAVVGALPMAVHGYLIIFRGSRLF